jgi:hypothetical protein
VGEVRDSAWCADPLKAQPSDLAALLEAGSFDLPRYASDEQKNKLKKVKRIVDKYMKGEVDE